MSKKQQQDKPGVFRTAIKVIMIIAFVIIGIFLLAVGIMGAIGKLKVTIEGEVVKQWGWIVTAVFGGMLLISPIMLNRKAQGFWWVFKIIIAIIFVLGGILLIVLGALPLAKHAEGAIWVPICNIVFGCLLLTSPFFLKK